jgi:Transmembrane secretion effector
MRFDVAWGRGLDRVHVVVQYSDTKFSARLGASKSARGLPSGFSRSVAAGSAIWGYAADHTSAHLALSFSGLGIVACILLRFPLPLPVAKVDLSSWNHWGKPALYAEPALDEGPILVTVEYTIDPKNAPEFLEVIYHYQRIRRRDGAVHWGIFYDSEIPHHGVN